MEDYPLNLLSLAIPSSKDIHDYVEVKNGLFSLSDSKTCNIPRRSEYCFPECDKKILWISSSSNVAIIWLDEWQHSLQSEKCDFMLFDIDSNKRKFSLCELTCSLEEYVIPDSAALRVGKRAKAYSQISNVWESLKNSPNPVFYNFILQFNEKVGIFGWRDRSSNYNSKGALNAMRSFTRTPGSNSGITKFTEYSVDGVFSFIQVKYPTVYHW